MEVDYPEGIDRYKYFARFLLEGKVSVFQLRYFLDVTKRILAQFLEEMSLVASLFEWVPVPHNSPAAGGVCCSWWGGKGIFKILGSMKISIWVKETPQFKSCFYKGKRL